MIDLRSSARVSYWCDSWRTTYIHDLKIRLISAYEKQNRNGLEDYNLKVARGSYYRWTGIEMVAVGVCCSYVRQWWSCEHVMWLLATRNIGVTGHVGRLPTTVLWRCEIPSFGRLVGVRLGRLCSGGPWFDWNGACCGFKPWFADLNLKWIKFVDAFECANVQAFDRQTTKMICCLFV